MAEHFQRNAQNFGSDRPLAEVMASVRAGFFGVGLMSLAINLLMLTGPLYMLQIYDRVLSSGSLPTLWALTLLVILLYGFWAAFSTLRSKLVSHMSYNIEQRLSLEVTQSWFRLDEKHRKENQPNFELARLRDFINSPIFTAFFDLPFAPLFLIIIFLLHGLLGWMTVAGILLIMCIALIAEILAKNKLSRLARQESMLGRFLDITQQQASTLAALGMVSTVSGRWFGMRETANALAQQTADQNILLSNIGRMFRMLLQSLVLGAGAYLVLRGELTAGGMITASILSGRALAPIDLLLGGWRNAVAARQSYRRLGTFLALVGRTQAKEAKLQLPKPVGQIQVINLVKLDPMKPPGETVAILQGIDFVLKPGDGLGVIGPTGSGKSSLARLLVGLWQADRGQLLLDGATLDQWQPDQLGRFLGYLPQTAELLPGTIGENIARFDPDARDEAIIEAAELATIHELITQLPKGYNSYIGEDVVLSGGQVQRLALARALFGRPSFIVLDEPNANLDVPGDKALAAAIQAVRSRGETVVVIAHRPSAVAALDKLLVLNKGRQADFGPKDEVLARLASRRTQQDSLSSASSKQPGEA